MKIKRIVVSQPEPQSEKSPYLDLAVRYNLKIDFKPFIRVEGLPCKDFRKQRIDILQHTAVVLTSRTAIDNFFRICSELRVTVPDEMKYFCITESIALYLQKYIVYRKRKIFFGPATFAELVDVMLKHKNETFLVPLSDVHKPEIPKLLDKAKLRYTKAICYRTVSADLSHFNGVIDYDMIIFYSPSGIKSLFKNFPEFVQGDIKIGAFGPSTAKAVRDSKLRLDLMAPTSTNTSMPQALEAFLKQLSRESK